MTILNNPNPKKEQIHICEKCQCEFSFNESDIKTDSYNNCIIGPGHFGYVKKYVICPNCGEYFYIYDSTKNKTEECFYESGIIPHDEESIIRDTYTIKNAQDLDDFINKINRK